MENANGMVTFPLAMHTDDNSIMNGGLFFSPIGGTSMKYSGQEPKERSIMDDVS